jgi:hypothetical protein
MGFKAFWGDMNFGDDKISSQPLEIDKKNEVEASSKVNIKLEKAAEGFADDDDDEVDDKGDGIKGSKEEEEEEEEDSKGKKPEEEEEEENKIEFSEEDIDKSFLILDSQGILDLDDDADLDATPEGIAEAVAMTVRRKVDAELASAPEAVKNLYNHLKSGKPIEDFDFVAPPEAWSEMNEEDEDNQRTAVAEFLILQGVDPEDVDEEIEDIIAAGKLGKKSEIAFKTLIKKEETDKESAKTAKSESQRKASETAQKEIEDIKKKIDETTTMANFKMTDARKQEFKDYLFKENKKSGKTQFQENMHSEDRKLKIAFMDFIEFTQDDMAKEIASDLTKERAKKLTRFKNTRTANTNSSVQTVANQKKANKGTLKIPNIFSARQN